MESEPFQVSVSKLQKKRGKERRGPGVRLARKPLCSFSLFLSYLFPTGLGYLLHFEHSSKYFVQSAPSEHLPGKVRKAHHNTHFTAEETEAQRGEVTLSGVLVVNFILSP